MNKKGNLLHLIKSLTPPEKRYFRLFCKMHQASSNHLRLFEVMDKQKEVNDGKIRMAFKGEAFLNQLHVTKNYLQSLILKSLRNFHASISKEAETRNLILDVEILFSKELFDQCYYTLEKAERLALKFDDFAALIDIYDWQRRLFNTKHGLGNVKFKEATNNQTKVVNELKKLNQYWQLIAGTSNYIDDEHVELGDAAEGQLEENSSLSFKVLYHHFHFSKKMMSRKGELALGHINKIIELLENNPDRIGNNPSIYLTSLGNKVPILLYEKRWQEALEVLQVMRNAAQRFKVRNSKLSARTICRSYNLELEIYRDEKDFTKGVERIGEVVDFMQNNSIPEDYPILFWNQFANIYFGFGDNQRALEWVNQILDYKKENWPGITSHVRILHLMIHFDLGNMFFIRYAVESHRRYLKKRKGLRRFERTCLKYFLKAAKSPIEKQSLELTKMHYELFESENPAANQDNLDYVDIKSWLEARGKTKL